MDRQWEEFFHRIQEENDFLLEEIGRLLEERDEKVRALEKRVLFLERQLSSRASKGEAASPEGGPEPVRDRADAPGDVRQKGQVAQKSEEVPVAPGVPDLPGVLSELPLPIEEWAKRSGRGVGEVQLMAALAERRTRRAAQAKSGSDGGITGLQRQR